MSHHNSYYAHSNATSNGVEDLASPIAVHHTSIASGYSHGEGGGAGNVNTSRRSNHANAGGSSSSMLRQQEELAAIQAEIEALKERRKQLEMQRRHAAVGNAPLAAAAGRASHQSSRGSSAHTASARASLNTSAADGSSRGYHSTAAGSAAASGSVRAGMAPPPSSSRQLHPYVSDEGVESRQHRRSAHSMMADSPSRVGSRSVSQHFDPNRSSGGGLVSRQFSSVPRRSASSSLVPHSSRPLDHSTFLPSEKERREYLATTHNAYRDMKEAMKASWRTDTTLVGGYFLTEDNPKTGTFGRARRFTAIQGKKDLYYLSTDMEELQRSARSRSRPHFSVSNRGKSGCNVNSHWNDPKGGCAPGPGAYTPRYQKLAPPSILARK